MKQPKILIFSALTVLSMGLLYFFVIAPSLDEESKFGICGDSHYLRECYNVDKSQCLSIWRSTEDLCNKRHLNEARKDMPMLLKGRLTQYCQEFEFNKIFKFMHSASQDASCRELEKRIQTYRIPSDF